MEIPNVLFEVHGLFEMLDLGARVLFSSRFASEARHRHVAGHQASRHCVVMRAAISIQSCEPLTGLDHVRSCSFKAVSLCPDWIMSGHVLSALGGGKQIVLARGRTLDTLLSNLSLSNRIHFLSNNLRCRIEYGFF